MSNLGDTGTHQAAGDNSGNGMALTGRTANATNTDSRTWRIDVNGNVLWNKVLNLETDAGSVETGSNIIFDDGTGPFIYVAGFRRCAYPMCGGYYIMCYNANTGSIVWGPENVEEDYGWHEDFTLQMDRNNIDNSLYIAGLSFTATDDLWHVRMRKYNEVILKEESAHAVQSELVLSPNPVSNILTFQNLKSGYPVQIIDLNGKIVAEFISEETTLLNVDHLIPGMYLVRIVDKEFQQTSSFVKMK